jgi:5-hydroxyisourate hydrolase-like protein (transthyretin family)
LIVPARIRSLFLLATALFLTGFAPSLAQAQRLSGVVTNQTNGKPAAGDNVVLLKLVQGMQELTSTKTDAKGHYTLTIPASEGAGSMHLVRVTHDRANYFAPVPPGTTNVDVEVYTAAADVDGVSVSEDVMQIQTTPDGGSLRVVEHYLLQNTSQPARTLFSEHPFELYLPAGSTVDGASAKSPGGMAVEQPLVPMGDPDHYTILFPIRPGETEFNIWYRIPYKGSFSFQPRPTLPTDALGIMMPRSMDFKPGPGTPYQSVSDQVGGKAQAYLARAVKPSQPLGFNISGKGELPRDTVGQGGNQAAAGAAAAGSATADPNSDTRPGGGLGAPLDKDAERDPWTKYRWWIIGGLGLAMAAAAGLMMRTPADPAYAVQPVAPSSALNLLKDELFAVETDRLEGRLTESEYTELKAAYDLVLRRALARNPAGAA